MLQRADEDASARKKEPTCRHRLRHTAHQTRAATTRNSQLYLYKLQCKSIFLGMCTLRMAATRASRATKEASRSSSNMSWNDWQLSTVPIQVIVQEYRSAFWHPEKGGHSSIAGNVADLRVTFPSDGVLSAISSATVALLVK